MPGLKLNAVFTSISIYSICLNILECQSSVIRGTLHSNVLLPCIMDKQDIDYTNLVVNWQRTENDVVVHSFFYGTSHPEYEDQQYRGRTVLFYDLLSEGNMSLLLKNLSESDTGSYMCYCMWDEYSASTTQYIQLLVQATLDLPEKEKEENNIHIQDVLNERNRLVTFSLLSLLLLPLLYLWLCQRKKKDTKAIDQYRKDILCKISESLQERKLLVMDMNKSPGSMKDHGYFQFKSTINSYQLLKKHRNKKLVADRMLLVGNSGTGKSSVCKWLQKKWAEGGNLAYKLIVYLSCKTMNWDEEFSLTSLLLKECKAPPSIFDCNPHDLLLIIDDVEEVIHTDDSKYESGGDNNRVYKLKDLVTKIIKKDLIPITNVMCVFNKDALSGELKKYFKFVYILQDSDPEIQPDKCGNNNHQSMDMVKESELLNFTSMPCYITILCNVLNNSNKDVTDASSPNDMFIRIFKLILRDINGKDLTETSFTKKASMAYKCLVQKETFETKNQKDVLTQKWNKIVNTNETCIHFVDNVLRDILAAVNCVWEIHSGKDLKECLDFWVFGKKPPENTLLIPANSYVHNARFFNFVKFFMRLLVYPNYDSLVCDTPVIKDYVRNGLEDWFKTYLKDEMKSHDQLKLINCLYDLQDEEIRSNVSPFFRKLNFCNIPLSYMEIQALAYSLKNSKLEELDLRLCTLQDRGVSVLKEIIKNAKYVLLSSNNLTEKSGYVLRKVLMDPECITETLSLGTNKLDNCGVQALWEGLAVNKKLKALYVHDNNICDSGTEGMTEKLKNNATLQELHLFGNLFNEFGLKNIAELKKHKKHLKIVIRIAEDEDLFNYVEKEILNLSTTWQNYDPKWLHMILDALQDDLRKEDCIGDSQIIKEKIINLSKKIDRLQKSIRPAVTICFRLPNV